MKNLIKQSKTWLMIMLSLAIIIYPAKKTLATVNYYSDVKAYSAAVSVMDGAAVVVTALAAELAARQITLEEARIALNTATNAATAASATAAVATAAAAVAAAEAAVIAAGKIAAAAAAVLAAWEYGTRVGEAYAWVWHICWDPLCGLTTLTPAYVAPSTAQIDSLIPLLIQQCGIPNLPHTRAAFDSVDIVSPGVGTACWNYMREGTRGFVIALRGGAAYSANLCLDVQMASADLQNSITQYANAIDVFDDVLANTTIYGNNNTIHLLDSAKSAVANLLNYANAFSNPPQAIFAINNMLMALNETQLTLRHMSTPAGNPRPLEGVNGFYPSLSLPSYLQFLNDCANIGEPALPIGEVQIVNTIMSSNGISLIGQPSAGPSIAAWHGEGDTGNEAILFGTGGLTASQVLHSSLSNHWNKLELCATPVWTGCGGLPCPTCLTSPMLGGNIVPSGTTSVCQGGSKTMSVVGASSGPDITYQWQIATSPTGTYSNVTGGSGANTLTYTTGILPLGNRYFKLKTTCTTSLLSSFSPVLMVSTLPLPNLNVNPTNPAVCSQSGVPVSLSATGNSTNYSWSPVSGLTPATGPIVSAYPVNTTTYTVTGTASNGCARTITRTVTVNPAVSVSKVEANPTAICPGGSSIINATAGYGTPSYCNSIHQNGCIGDNIFFVQLNTINNFSGSNCGDADHYTYFNSGGNVTTTLVTSGVYNLMTALGFDSSQYVGAWIDYNQNRTFESGEFLGASGNAGPNGTVNISFMVPAGALNGLTRLRIIGGNDLPLLASQACGASSSPWGETQDYNVTITGGVNPFSYLWTTTPLNATLSSHTTNPVTASAILSNTTYTVTVSTVSGCNGSGNTTLNPDTQAPIITCPNPITISCDMSPIPSGIPEVIINPNGGWWVITDISVKCFDANGNQVGLTQTTTGRASILINPLGGYWIIDDNSVKCFDNNGNQIGLTQTTTGRATIVINPLGGFWLIDDNSVKCFDNNGNQVGLTQTTTGRATIVINPNGGFWLIDDNSVKCFDNNGNQVGLTQTTTGRATIVINPNGGFWLIDDNSVKCFDNNGNQVGLTQTTTGRATIVINPLGGFWLIDDNSVKCFDANGNQVGLTQTTTGKATIVINPLGGFWLIDDNSVKCFDANGNQVGLTQTTTGKATIVINPLGGFWLIDDNSVKCFEANGNQVGLTQTTTGKATIVINPLGGFWLIDNNSVKCFDANGNQIGLTQTTTGKATIVINPLGGFWLIDDNSVKCFDANGNQVGLTQTTTGRATIVINPLGGFWLIDNNSVKCFDANGNQIGLTQTTTGKATIVINPLGGFWLIDDNSVKCFDANGNQVGLTQTTTGRATIVINPLGGFWLIDDNSVKCFDANGNQVGLTQTTTGKATIVINPLGGFWLIDNNSVKCFDANGNQVGLTQSTNGRATITPDGNGGFWMTDKTTVKCFNANGNQVGLTQSYTGGASATDSSGNYTITFADNIISGNCAGNKDIQRTWTATDGCSNTASITQIIHVQDNTAPVMTAVSNTTVQCNNANQLLYFWICSATVPAGLHPYDLHVLFSGTGGSIDNEKITQDPGVPPGTISHSNGNGNTNTVDIVWTNPLNPGDVVEFEFSTLFTPVTVVASWWTDSSHNFLDSANASVTSHGNFPSTGHPEISDNCNPSPSLTYNDVMNSGGSPGNYSFVRTWTGSDGCNNSNNITQTITVHDITAPVLSNCPVSFTAATCGSAPVFWTPPTATDNCNAQLQSNFQPGAILPVGTTTVVYTASDSAGNTASCSFNITVVPSHTVTIFEDQSISCAGNNDASIQAVASGSGTYNYILDGGVSSNPVGFFAGLNPGIHTVCAAQGNCASCATIAILEPSPIAISISLDTVPSCGLLRGLTAVITGGTKPFPNYFTYWRNSSNVLLNPPPANYDTSIHNLPPGTYTLEVEDDHGCFATSSFVIPNVPCNTTLNLTCLIEGYWNGSNAMVPVLFNQGRPNSLNQCDTITVELHPFSNYSVTAYTTKAMLNTNGTATVVFPNAVSGNYYIVIKHRNALTTWSANAISFGPSTSYNFTTSASQAYGSNQAQVSPGIFAFYNGDMPPQDENIDLLDLSELEGDISNFLFGYYHTDLNGDGNVDLLDSPGLESNISNFIFAVHP